jgi:hypothetical protein
MSSNQKWVLGVVATASLLVLGAVEPQDVGRGSGAFSTPRQLGGAFGVAVLVAVFAGAGGYGSAQEFTDGFVPAIAACGGLAVAAALAGSALPGKRRAGTRDLPTSAGPNTRGRPLNDMQLTPLIQPNKE